MTLVLRKLLASSTFAIAGALDTLIARLKAKLGNQSDQSSLEVVLDEDYGADETAEEWGNDPAETEVLTAGGPQCPQARNPRLGGIPRPCPDNYPKRKGPHLTGRLG